MSGDPQLTANAIRVLESRYLRRSPAGDLIESPVDMFRRVARGVAAAERKLADVREAERQEERFFELLSSLDFLPNSPTLMNAGTRLGQLSACFVLPVGDSMEGIFDALKLMALVQQSGGGTGFSFSRLRPRGDFVASTGGRASGPVSFMRIFDSATENIRQGGRRRGANMAVLRADHPDIEEFVGAKLDDASFENFNLSVAADDAFMRRATSAQAFDLVNPRTGEQVASIDASELLRHIAEAAWQTGDPGLVFLDAINRANPTPAAGAIEATNPCGEVPLLPYEACTLGSVNLARVVRGDGVHGQIDWDRLRETTRVAVRFLDDVIEVSRWPSPKIAAAVMSNRKLGLGVMGFADMLVRLGIPYGSTEAVSTAEDVMATIAEAALSASEQLARERGVFGGWDRSVYAARELRVRNATRTSIAPTGTIGIIAGTSAGIEPLFALAYRRSHVLEDETLVELNPLFVRYARAQGFYDDELAGEIARRGSLAAVTRVPDEAKALFRTALELSPDEHLAIQEAFQRHVDNAVSKTVNLPRASTAADVEGVYVSAWKRGLKGITVYRYGSKSRQVLELGADEEPEEHEHFRRCDPNACKL